MPTKEQLQDAYQKLRQNQEKQRDMRKSFRDELEHNERYQNLIEELTKLKEEKKRLESEAYARVPTEIMQLEALKTDAKSQAELVSDLAIALYTEKETVEVTDEYENIYEPIFSVKFKKTGDQKKGQLNKENEPLK